MSTVLSDICYNGHCSRLLDCKLPMGAPSSSSITSSVDCAPRKQDAAFFAAGVRESDLQGAALSESENAPLHMPVGRLSHNAPF